MALPVVWTPEASGELIDAAAFVAVGSERQASLFVRRALAAAVDLGDFPLQGHVVEGSRDETLREVPVRGFRMVYRVRREEVRILSFFRGTREFPDIADRIRDSEP
jgi:toxin ParE1/3/4